MKKIILIPVFCFLISTSFAQPVIRWQKCYGGSSSESSNSIERLSNGDFIVASVSSSNDGDVTGNHGNNDFWIMRIDAQSNIIWQKSLGGSDAEYWPHIKATSDSGFMVFGYTYSNNGDVSGNQGFEDAWVVKTDSLGSIEWQKSVGGSSADRIRSGIQTGDGGFVFAGETFSNDGDVSGNNGICDYWIFKLDSAGNLLWQKCYGGTDYDYAWVILQADDGGFVVSGGAHSNDGDVSGSHGDVESWIIKTDSAGNLQWQKCLGGSSGDMFYDGIRTNDGSYVFSGSSSSNDWDVSGNHGGLDTWVVKTDSIGNIQWQTSLGGSSEDACEKIIQTIDNNYVVGGFTRSDDGDITTHIGGFYDTDYWIVKLDSTGNMMWNKCFGGLSDDQSYGLSMAADGEILMAGYTTSGNIDVSGYHPPATGTLWSDAWIIRLTENYNSITGKTFCDINNNQAQDAGEPGFADKMITEINTGRLGFSRSDGSYMVSVLDTGNYEDYPSPVNYYNPVPLTQPAYFSGINQTDSLNDFAFQSAGVFNDLCITINPISNFRADMNANYRINYENAGTTTLNGTVIFFPDNDVTFVSSNVTPTSVTTDSVVWNVGTLTPFQTGSILVTVHVNAGTPIGTLINSSVVIEPVAGDANTACNYNSWEVFVTGAVDPNAILVDRDTILTTELSSAPYLNYIIYFQNTGNDTAFNVRVLNNIPQLLDVSSFEFVASSHPMNITYGAHARLMEFTFDNILLPDSNVNEPASHGFIRYKIKPLSTLVAGDSIKNNAAIYFDFNYPVLTDTAVTEIVLPTGISQWPVASGQLGVYPNPAREELTINSYLLTGKNAELKIYDLFGREVFQLQTRNQKPETKINVSSFSQGVYFVQLQSGEQVLRGKFLKE